MPSAFSRTNTAIGTPQARWREITQSGRLSIMPLMRFSPAAGTQRVVLISRERNAAQGAVQALDRLVHGDEPLRRVAEDDGLLRAPGVRVLMLQPAARDDVAGGGERLDDGLVGVALLALVVDDALALEAGGMRGERAVLIDGVGNRRIDAARFECARIRGPDFEVLAAVARRGVDEARAGVVGDVIAGEERHIEVVAALALRADERQTRASRTDAGTVLRLSRRQQRAPA